MRSSASRPTVEGLVGGSFGEAIRVAINRLSVDRYHDCHWNSGAKTDSDGKLRAYIVRPIAQ